MRKRNGLLIAILVASTAHHSAAQQLSNSSVWLFQTTTGSASWTLSKARFLTGFNLQGYNNQPFFATDDRLWITVQQGDQTDIHELNLAGTTHTAMTETPGTSEYSAAMAPGGSGMTVVRVEPGGAQRLWLFTFDGYGPTPLFPDIVGVGYYAWLSDSTAALFIVGPDESQHSLVIASSGRSQPERVSGNPGRCLRTTHDGRLAFVYKATQQTWFLKTYDPSARKFASVAVMPKGVEDFVVLPDDGYLCAEGSKLMLLTADKKWKMVADLAPYGIPRISRMAINARGELAVVAEAK